LITWLLNDTVKQQNLPVVTRWTSLLITLNTIKLVVFDLDGTLLDSVPDIALATNQTLQALRKAPLSESQIRDFVGNGADVCNTKP
jgi:hypothetical protein